MVAVRIDEFEAVIFDMDGVVTDTAKVHADCWKHAFDRFLRDRAQRTGQAFHEFTNDDYLRSVDGKPRYDGAATFLRSREVDLPRGDPADPPGFTSVCAIANLKDLEFERLVTSEGVTPFPTTISFIRSLRERRLRTALISSSRHAKVMLAGAGITDLFDVVVDGIDAESLVLPGKPDPAIFLTAARLLGVAPSRSAIVEDALAGVEAGRRGGFGLVVGVDRSSQSEALRRHGADVVVRDLGDLERSLSTSEGPTTNGGSAGVRDTSPAGGDEWLLVYDHFDAPNEGLRESLCTLGNGYFATRGAAPEAVAGGAHYPGTYVAGLYNRRSTQIAGRTVENESLVNVPNWLPFTFRIDGGAWFELGNVELLDFSQELDLRRAVLTRTVRARDPDGRVTRIRQQRFVSMANRHVAALETVLWAENWSGRLEIRSGLDGRIVNAGVPRYRRFDEHHLVDVRVHAVDDETIALSARTSQSGVEVAQAVRNRIECAAIPECQVHEAPGFIAHEFSVEVTPSVPVTLEKVVTLFTSRDRSVSDASTEARLWCGRLGSFRALLADHIREWSDLWKRFSLELECDDGRTRLILHLHIFHLLQTTSRNTVDLDVGVPARGLHGEAYRGHVFWDELFIFPYLNLHLPELVRSLLLYRYRRLPEARWAASQAGFRGAMYPWQSGSNGREESQVLHLNPLSGRWLPDASHLQRHINAAIAYNIWRFYQATGDIDFMITFGAEMMFEISRFWASIARYDRTLDRYEIVGVMGPDEYHDGYVGASAPGLRNNSYTNVMAAWVLSRALDLVELLPEPRRSELRLRLSLDDSELAQWEEISRKMRLIFHRDGVISQFEGYEDLAELDWDAYRDRYGDISRLDRILEGENDTANAYKASKQADVLMLFYLFSSQELEEIFHRLGYAFDSDAIPGTIDYYLQRTSHGSTLSRVVHSWVLARSDREQSWRFYEDALRSDLDDTQGGTTAEGIHLGAMAGTVDLLQRCYLGIEVRDDGIWFHPLLPAEVESITLDIRYRRRWINVTVADSVITVEAADWGEGSARVGLDGRIAELAPGERRQMAL